MADVFHLLFLLLLLKQPPSGWGYVPGHLLQLSPWGQLLPAVLHLLPDSGKAQGGPAGWDPREYPSMIAELGSRQTAETLEILSPSDGHPSPNPLFGCLDHSQQDSGLTSVSVLRGHSGGVQKTIWGARS